MPIMDYEIWKDIDGYESRYQISNFGRVKSLERKVNSGIKNNDLRCVNEKILGQRNFKSYKKIILRIDGKKKNSAIHRFVGTAFIPNPENKPFINHIDGNGSNNGAWNLEWCTHSENMIHSYQVLKNKPNTPWLGKFGKNNPKSKEIFQYDLGMNFIKRWDCIMQIQRELGIKRKNISNCINGVCKVSANYIWRTERCQ